MTCCKCKCNSNRADCGINLLADANSRLLDDRAHRVVRCSSCNDQTIATSKCTYCDDMLCDACVSAHKRVKLTRDHPIVPLNIVTSSSSITKISKRYSCAKHSTERLQLFCNQCNKVTCVKCHELHGDHYNHRKSEVDEAAVHFRKNLHLQLKNLTEKVSP